MTKWNDEKIEREVRMVMEKLNIKHFPTRSELDEVTGNTALTNAVAKGHGFRVWAMKLGVPVKDTNVKFGNMWEYRMMDYLASKGYEVEKMTHKHPYDLLVNEYIKIDVKASKTYDSYNSTIHTFDLGSNKHNCDIFILVALDKNEQIDRLLVIPSSDLMGQKQVVIGKESKYNKYNYKYEVIEKYNKFYQRLKNYTVDFL